MIKIKDHDITAIKTTYGDIVKVVTKIGNEVKVLWEQAAPEPEGLPAEYQQVEYIASNVEAYIDTKISIVPDLLAEMDLLFEGSGNTDHGVYNSGKRFHVGVYSSKWILGIGNKYTQSSGYKDANKHRFVLANTSSPYAQIDDTKYTNFTQYTQGGTFLFFRKEANKTDGNNLKRVYWAKFSVGDTVLGEFIPCYRKSDGKTGMYNLVTKEFLTSLTSKDFEKGPDINN